MVGDAVKFFGMGLVLFLISLALSAAGMDQGTFGITCGSALVFGSLGSMIVGVFRILWAIGETQAVSRERAERQNKPIKPFQKPSWRKPRYSVDWTDEAVKADLLKMIPTDIGGSGYHSWSYGFVREVELKPGRIIDEPWSIDVAYYDGEFQKVLWFGSFEEYASYRGEMWKKVA